MPQEPSPEDVDRWHRWFAIEMNNCAWTLAENPSRSPGQRDEMLDAAHAAAMHWREVGTELNRARSDMLLGQVHALARNGSLAMLYARRSHEYAIVHECPAWELALAHAGLERFSHGWDAHDHTNPKRQRGRHDEEPSLALRVSFGRRHTTAKRALANAAYAASELSLYQAQYALAKTLGDSIADSAEREILERTFNQLPIPEGTEGAP